MYELSGSPPQGDHPRFHAHGLQLGTVKVVRTPRQLLEVYVGTHVHLPRVDAQDVSPCVLSGKGELDFSVQAPCVGLHVCVCVCACVCVCVCELRNTVWGSGAQLYST